MKRCKKCNKFLFILYKAYKDNFYCSDCFDMVKKKDIEEENKRNEEERERKEQEKKKQLGRAKIRNKIADKKLREELKQEKIKQEEKRKKKEEKLRKKLQKREIKEEIKKKEKKYKKNIIFEKETIENNESLLYIKADVKRILVIEWFNGKKRVILHNEREIRRTHAGGFAAEKFQKFVDQKKKKTIEWILNNLEKPGILREKYEIVKVEAKDDLKEGIEDYLAKLRYYS